MPIALWEITTTCLSRRLNQTSRGACATLNPGRNKLQQLDYTDIIDRASTTKWTRDTFDRLIVAASIKQQTLLTKDKNILENYPFAIWE